MKLCKILLSKWLYIGTNGSFTLFIVITKNQSTRVVQCTTTICIIRRSFVVLEPQVSDSKVLSRYSTSAVSPRRAPHACHCSAHDHLVSLFQSVRTYALRESRLLKIITESEIQLACMPSHLVLVQTQCLC